MARHENTWLGRLLAETVTFSLTELLQSGGQFAADVVDIVVGVDERGTIFKTGPIGFDGLLPWFLRCGSR